MSPAARRPHRTTPRTSSGIAWLLVLVGWALWPGRDRSPDNALPPGLVSGIGTALSLVVGIALAAVCLKGFVLGGGGSLGAALGVIRGRSSIRRAPTQ
jgi:hypothetical protein